MNIRASPAISRRIPTKIASAVPEPVAGRVSPTGAKGTPDPVGVILFGGSVGAVVGSVVGGAAVGGVVVGAAVVGGAVVGGAVVGGVVGGVTSPKTLDFLPLLSVTSTLYCPAGSDDGP